MEENNRFQMDVEVVAQALKRRAGKEDPYTTVEKLYKQFQTTRQEPVKLAVALRGYFIEAASDAQRHDFEIYLKSRIRPTIRTLIDEEDVAKIEYLEQQGWFGSRELEYFIKTAREHKKTASLVWFLHLKNEKYGFEEQDFSL